MNVKEIPIDKIKIYQNIRSEQKDVSGLMKSIEREGLLHPIGVYRKDSSYILAYGYRRLQAMKKLNWKTIPAVILTEEFTEEDFLTKNTIENIHRSNVTPIELGRVCKLFINRGFSKSEIASKLHIPVTRVATSYGIYINVPKKYRDTIGFISRGAKNRGKIPAEVAYAIVNLRISGEDKDKVFESARKKELSIRHVNLIAKIMRSANISVEEAIKNLDKYLVKNIFLICDVDQYDKVIDEEISLTNYVKEIIEGKRKPNPDLLIR